MKEIKPGDNIHIYHMYGESEYRDTEGTVIFINDDTNEIYGTWGDLPLYFSDDWEVIDRSKDNAF